MNKNSLFKGDPDGKIINKLLEDNGIKVNDMNGFENTNMHVIHIEKEPLDDTKDIVYLECRNINTQEVKDELKFVCSKHCGSQSYMHQYLSNLDWFINQQLINKRLISHTQEIQVADAPIKLEIGYKDGC